MAVAEAVDPRRTFGELIHAYTWSDVEPVFERLYPGTDDWVIDHGRVFHTLRTLTPRLSDYDLVIGTIDTPDYGEWVDISGRNGDEVVAIEFVDWAEWLGMVLDRATAERFSSEEVIAHAVWELSFFGFDEASIQERWHEIESLATRTASNRRSRR